MNYAVIMAGGSGTRLWPLSRKNSPKQFHSLLSEKTLIQETYERIRTLLPDEQIFISSTPEYKDEVMKQLPQLPKDNCIIEPTARNTTAAHGFIAFHLLNLDPDAVFCTMPSDHTIKDVPAFIDAVKASFEAVDKYPDHLVTIGLTPTSPETGLGYIKTGRLIDTINGQNVYDIDAFIEKPDLETAEKYLADTGYLWNSADYFFRADALLDWIDQYRPHSYEILDQINDLILEDGDPEEIKALYETIEKEQLADSVVEQDGFESLVIPANIGWSDVGNWGVIHHLLNESQKLDIVSRGNHVDFDSSDCIVYGREKLIATIGLKDIVIIDSPDAILITTRQDAQNVKHLLDKIDEKYL